MRAPGQIDGALMHGNRVRLARAELCRAIKARESEPAAVILHPPWYAEAMLVVDLLACCPGVGPNKLRLLNVRGARAFPPVNLLAPLADLSTRQRDWLIRQLPTLIAVPAAA